MISYSGIDQYGIGIVHYITAVIGGCVIRRYNRPLDACYEQICTLDTHIHCCRVI